MNNHKLITNILSLLPNPKSIICQNYILEVIFSHYAYEQNTVRLKSFSDFDTFNLLSTSIKQNIVKAISQIVSTERFMARTLTTEIFATVTEVATTSDSSGPDDDEILVTATDIDEPDDINDLIASEEIAAANDEMAATIDYHPSGVNSALEIAVADTILECLSYLDIENLNKAYHTLIGAWNLISNDIEYIRSEGSIAFTEIMSVANKTDIDQDLLDMRIDSIINHINTVQEALLDMIFEITQLKF
ncbi:MAG: hypothetical protein ATN31_06495 [Candidatus Epulonipiscioides saccharophilum]|nr:MAG: hypothetical protein ATN31_06495 [Epulopiscium sp. AS2M-Bin001]